MRNAISRPESSGGDTHVHTDNSLDARGFGVTLDVATAYRFAQGEEVITSNGMPSSYVHRSISWS